jgi:polysaccharide export outer membrane protein
MSGVQQQVSGEHLVAMDGYISLGTYGRVYVTGMTLDHARFAIEAHLSAYLDNPQVSVDVFAYNSKVYYVITQGTIVGDGVFRLPITGNETVLDAISQIQGLQPHSSKNVWVARPAPPGSPCTDQVLPVDWLALTKLGTTSTNYQIFPGDRIYVSEDPWITADGIVAKVISPFERMMGFTILGQGMVRGFRFFHQGNGTGGAGGGGF